MALTDPVLRRSALHAIGEIWAQSDPVDALDFLANVADRVRRWHLEHTLVERWVAIDPEGLADAVEARIPHEWAGRILQLAIGEVAQLDPERALAIVAARPPWRRDALEREAYSVWAANDFETAVAHARKFLPSDRRVPALRQMVYRRGERAPLQVLDWVLAQPEPDRTELLDNAIQVAVQHDAHAAVDWLVAASDDRSRPLALAPHIVGVAQRNPQAAVQLLEAVPERNRHGAYYNVAHYYAYADRAAALNWARTVPEPHREQALRAVVGVWARLDIEAASDFVAASEQPAALMQPIVRARAETDPLAALDWVEGFAASERAASLQIVAGAWARTDPRSAAETMLARGYEGRESAIDTAVREWARRDPQAVAHWVATSNNEELARRSVNGLLPAWTDRDPDHQEVVAWTRRLPPAARDAAFTQYLTRHAVDMAPDQAVGLANEIGVENQRWNTIFTILRRNGDMLPSALDRALALANVSDTRREEMRARLADNSAHNRPPHTHLGRPR